MSGGLGGSSPRPVVLGGELSKAARAGMVLRAAIAARLAYGVTLGEGPLCAWHDSTKKREWLAVAEAALVSAGAMPPTDAPTIN